MHAVGNPTCLLVVAIALCLGGTISWAQEELKERLWSHAMGAAPLVDADRPALPQSPFRARLASEVRKKLEEVRFP